MYLRPPFCPGERAPDAPMVRMPLFADRPCGRRPPKGCKPPRPCGCPPPPPLCPPCAPHGIPAAPPVCVVNPFDPCERATVLLSIDECGNLIVCVKR